MSTQKTKDDKLREAAIDILKENSTLSNEDFASSTLYGSALVFMLKLAKSKEAAEYHQSLQPVVDVEQIREAFINFCHQNLRENITLDAVQVVFNYFKPHLQPPAPESNAVDPVDFFTWLIKNRDVYFNSFNPAETFIKEALYQYKQPKTNSDGKK